MKLEILYVPTTDLDASLGFYRGLGWTDLWREGASTAALASPDGHLQLMLDVDPEATIAPMFVVDSVLAHHDALPAGMTVVAAPAAIPGGYLATYREPGGSLLHVIDQSSDNQVS